MDSFEENLATMSMPEPDLQSSAMTGSTSEESVSGNNGWLSDFRSIAWSLQQTAGGVASFVHRSAIAIADEIAQLEQEEIEKHHSEASSCDHHTSSDDATTRYLPWELPSLNDDKETYEEDLLLKDKMQLLAEDDRVFLGPYTMKRDEDAEFLDEARIALIRRLLQVDEGLARTHARLSGRSDVRETLFWKNYFYHVEQTKHLHLEETREDKLAAMTSSVDSLVAAEETTNEDDSNNEEQNTFVRVPRPPASLNSLGVHSVDSMVVIDGSAAIPQDP